MTSPASPPVRGKKRWMKPLAYLIAFLFVPVLVGGVTLYTRYQSLSDARATPWTGDLPPVPEHQPGKRIAVVLAGNRGTEATDLIAPYQVLAASDSFNVYVVAPERRPSTLFPGSPMLPGVDLIPHLSFADYEARVGAAPDLIVIPFIPTATNTPHRAPEDAPIIPWIQEHASARTVVLSICGGTMTLADTGLLDGRPATSHQNVLRVERNRHPEIRWTDGRRYVEAGNVVSSAGITAGIDATLFVLGRMLGVTTAKAVAREIGYPHTRFLDDPAYPVPSADHLVELLSGGFHWGTTDLGLVLTDGVDEMALAAVMDSYPRSYAAVIHTVTPGRQVVRTRYGLDLAPSWSFDDVPALDRIVVLPGGAAASIDSLLAAQSRDLVSETFEAPSGQFAYDVTLADMARRDGARIARAAAAGLEYPAEHLGLEGGWPAGLLLRVPLLGLVGLLLTRAVGRAFARRRRSEATARLIASAV